MTTTKRPPRKALKRLSYEEAADLNARVAAHVFGRPIRWGKSDGRYVARLWWKWYDYSGWSLVPRFAERMDSTWLIVEHLRDTHELDLVDRHGRGVWAARFTRCAGYQPPVEWHEHRDAPVAICLAALAAINTPTPTHTAAARGGEA